MYSAVMLAAGIALAIAILVVSRRKPGAALALSVGLGSIVSIAVLATTYIDLFAAPVLLASTYVVLSWVARRKAVAGYRALMLAQKYRFTARILLYTGIIVAAVLGLLAVGVQAKALIEKILSTG